MRRHPPLTRSWKEGQREGPVSSAHCPQAQRLTVSHGQNPPCLSLQPESSTRVVEPRPLFFPRKVALGPPHSSPNSSHMASPVSHAFCLESPLYLVYLTNSYSASQTQANVLIPNPRPSLRLY